MTYRSAAVTVTTSATSLGTSGVGRGTITLQNLGSDYLYIGGSNVTTVNGLRIGASASVSLDATAAEELFGIVGSGTAEVRVLRHGSEV